MPARQTQTLEKEIHVPLTSSLRQVMSTKFTSFPFKIFQIHVCSVLTFLLIFTQCVPEPPSYTVSLYEGNITITTDSTSKSSFYELTIHRSSTYSNFISLNGVNYKFISNGNQLIIDDTLLNEVNGFLHAEGEMVIQGDSLLLDLTVSQYSSDTTLYFRTTHEGILTRVP